MARIPGKDCTSRSGCVRDAFYWWARRAGAGRGGRGRAARVSVPIYPTLHRRHFAAVLCIVVLEIFVLLSAGVIHNYQSSLLVIYFC